MCSSDLDWSSEATFGKLSVSQRELIRLTNTNGREFDPDHIQFQNYLYSKGIKQELAGQTKYNSAWIDPEGRFFGCPDQAHKDAAEVIMRKHLSKAPGNAENELEKLGWIKLSSGRIVYDFRNVLLPNLKQWETVLAWMRNPINKQCLSGKRVYNVGKDMYFSAALIEQNINATK